MTGGPATHGPDTKPAPDAGSVGNSSDSTKRFLGLDGLRGLAALAVVVWHTGATRFIPGAYLAVDLFFGLSGFVLSHAYEGRKLTWLGFARHRLIRLYPLYALGTAVGALVFALQIGVDSRFWESLAAAVAFFPTPASWGFYRPYPLDNPAWSLLFELLVNGVWFAILPRLADRVLWIIVAISTPALIAVAAYHGSLDTSAGADFFALSTVRTVFSFGAGCALYRLWRSGRITWHPPTLLAPAIFFAAIAALSPRGRRSRSYDPSVPARPRPRLRT